MEDSGGTSAAGRGLVTVSVLVAIGLVGLLAFLAGRDDPGDAVQRSDERFPATSTTGPPTTEPTTTHRHVDDRRRHPDDGGWIDHHLRADGADRRCRAQRRRLRRVAGHAGRGPAADRPTARRRTPRRGGDGSGAVVVRDGRPPGAAHRRRTIGARRPGDLVQRPDRARRRRGSVSASATEAKRCPTARTSSSPPMSGATSRRPAGSSSEPGASNSASPTTAASRCAPCASPRRMRRTSRSMSTTVRRSALDRSSRCPWPRSTRTSRRSLAAVVMSSPASTSQPEAGERVSSALWCRNVVSATP